MNWMLRFVVATLLVTGCVAAGAAENCAELSGKALKTRDVETSRAAYASCKQLAAAKAPEGLYHLGLLQRDGIGTTPDPEAGLALLVRAADQGYATAQARLGRIYLRGYGVTADPATAATWFRKAAEAGDPLAQYELGQLHYKGQGVAKDPLEAYKWFSAARAGYARSGDPIRTKLAERKATTLGAKLDDAGRAAAARWLDERFSAAKGG